MEPITVTATIRWFDAGMGAWGLLATDGQTYELGTESGYSLLAVD